MEMKPLTILGIPAESVNASFQPSTQLLVDSAQDLGIGFEVLDPIENIVRFFRGGHSEIVHQATMTRLDALSVQGVMMSKGLCKRIFQQESLSVPAGYWCTPGYAKTKLTESISETDCVVKPNVQCGGTGVSFVPKRSPLKFEAAIDLAAEYCDSILIEDWVKWPEYRVLVIDFKVVSSVLRIPAFVAGDGHSTVDELIQKKNRTRRERGFSSEYDLRTGDTEDACLADQGFDTNSVPRKDHHVHLRYNSNVHTGGDCKCVHMPMTCHNAAVKAARALDSRICGIDMLVGESIEQILLLEGNFNPDLAIHALPTIGDGDDVAQSVFAALNLI